MKIYNAISLSKLKGEKFVTVVNKILNYEVLYENTRKVIINKEKDYNREK